MITMNTNNHERPKYTYKSHRAAEEGAFDSRKIKKESNDIICGEIDVNAGYETATSTATTTATTTTSTPTPITATSSNNLIINDDHSSAITRERSTNSSRQSNGFHPDLQEILAAKLTNSHGLSVTAKNDKIRLLIKDSISEESRLRVQEVYRQIEQLEVDEKLLLYLELPALLTNPNGTVDPLRQPLNPLGNRYEIHQTIMWIKTHLEEDPEVSLPKQEVYDEYNIFCIKNSMKPLSTADFGKVMKQVYPRVRPRRLGTRGNSRYCYAGMRKRVKLDTPTLPSIIGVTDEDDFEEIMSEEMLGAASTLIREWAENSLGYKFTSLSALARHLVDNLCVNTRSMAAVCILSASGDVQNSSNKIAETPLKSSTPVGGKSAKLREAQLQLQKKLQQRDQKSRNSEAIVSQSKESNGGSDAVKNSTGKSCKKSRTSLSQSPQTTNSTGNVSVKSSLSSSLVTTSRSRKLSRSASQASTVSPQLNCDNAAGRTSVEPLNNGSNARSCTSTPNDSIISRETIVTANKNSRKRVSLDQTRINNETSPEKQAKLDADKDNMLAVKNNNNNKNNSENEVKFSLSSKLINTNQRSNKITVLSPGNLKIKNDNVIKIVKYRDNNNLLIDNNRIIKSNGRSSVYDTNINAVTTPVIIDDTTSILLKDQVCALQDTNSNTTEDFLVNNKNDKLTSLDADALDDYLNGGNNSQEPEEELLQYFQQSSSSSSDADVTSLSLLNSCNNTISTASTGNNNNNNNNNNNTTTTTTTTTTITSTDIDQTSRSAKVSQLRLILQQNLKDGTTKTTDIIKKQTSNDNINNNLNTNTNININNNNNNNNNSNSNNNSNNNNNNNSTNSNNNNNTNNNNNNNNQLGKRQVQKNDIILPTLLNNSNNSNSRRRVSFETNVIEHNSEVINNNNNLPTINTIPQSPNTRRRTFNFTPISPGPHSPINGRASKPNSANASPFVSPRNTPVPRSRSNIANVYRSSRNNKSYSRSNSCSVTYISKNNSDATDSPFLIPTSTNETIKLLTSGSVGGETGVGDKMFGCNKTAQVQVDTSSIGSIRLGPDDNSKTALTSLLSDVNPQKQLLINYPSQENLLEIKNLNSKPAGAKAATILASKPADQEISELLNSVKPYSFSNNEHYYRSQSVPLHRTINPTLISPISAQFYSSNNSFNPSTSSSLVHTPVPSEYDDFGSITGQSDSYLLDQVDANFINDDQQFLIEDKTISSENINKIFDLFDDNNDKGLNNILNEQNNEEEDDNSSLIVLDQLPSDSISIQDTMLDPSTLNPSVDSFQKIIIQQQQHHRHQLQSRSYPNTPLPNSITPSTYHQSFTEDSNGPRSYPPTPISSSHIGSQDIYRETNEPMLSSPTLNSLNLHASEHGNNDPADSVCRNVSDLLETNFLTDGDHDDGLDPLSNFDGLQDVDSLTPLFNEVSDANR